jgi:hypothetical protein
LPIFSGRKDLPEKLRIIEYEWDIISGEVRDMAEDVAELEKGEVIPPEGGKNGCTKANLR